jgi:hypothetical protein
MSKILTTSDIDALRGLVPDALLESHEALRKHAKMGWDAAALTARQIDDKSAARMVSGCSVLEVDVTYESGVMAAGGERR